MDLRAKLFCKHHSEDIKSDLTLNLRPSVLILP